MKFVTPVFSALLFTVAATGTLLSAPPEPEGLFVAVGYGGFRGWSADGQHWKAERWSDKNQDDINIIFSLAYRKGVFLSSGGGSGKGFILRSTDGKHWTQVVQTRWRITGVLALEDRFFSVFDEHFQSSPDGVTWTAQAEASTKAAEGGGSGYFRRWVSGNGAIVFAGDYALEGGLPRVGWIGGTRNGETPMRIEKQSGDVCGLAFGNSVFIAATKDGNILRSADGLHFETVATSGDVHEDNSIRLSAGVFYLRGKKGTQSSTDGREWKPVEHAPRIPSAVSPEGVAVDHGWGGIQVAADGKTFQKAEVPIDPTGICAVVYGVPKDVETPADK